MIDYQTIRTERQFRSSTGCSRKEFDELAKSFKMAYLEIMGCELSDAYDNLKKEIRLTTYEDCLFFVLFQLKNGLTYDALGVIFEMGTATAKDNFDKYIPVLERSLKNLGLLPQRSFEDIKAFRKYFSKVGTIIIDGSEQATERPKDNEAQKSLYSGKKRNIPTRKS